MTRSKAVDYHSNPNWLYSGDVNAQYGGIWIRHYGDYCDAWRITDLDSACGADGMVLIENCSVGLRRSLREDIKRIKSALRSYGWSYENVRNYPRQQRHAMIWEALISYGYGDSQTFETLQLDAEYPLESCNWSRPADRRQANGDIGGYVMAKYLD